MDKIDVILSENSNKCEKNMNDEVEKIRKSVDIVDIIKNYISLEKRGKNYFGICPFHKDTSPSLSVSPEKQIYNCFSCGASGNVITFVMNYEKVTFDEALEILKNRK